MASGPSVTTARAVLDMILPGVDVRLWTVAPGFDGTGGTEVNGGGYAPAALTASPAVAGTGGQIAKALSSNGVLFAEMPVASSDVVAISLHDSVTGALVALNDSWSSPVAWGVGDSPLIPAGSLVVPFVPVA